MVVMVMPASDGLTQILNVWELPGLGGAGEVRRERVELVRGGGIAFRLGGLGRVLKVGRDLLRELLVLREGSVAEFSWSWLN